MWKAQMQLSNEAPANRVKLNQTLMITGSLRLEFHYKIQASSHIKRLKFLIKMLNVFIE